jgi:hypothetical protein
VLYTRNYLGDRTFESAYRVWEFRRVLVGGMREGRGLVQFWGERRCRRQDRSNGPWSPWKPPTRRDPDNLHTVGIGDIVKIADPKH